ncbi:MAG TPA: RNA polymerase sigma factor, partial [Nannocystaceae bacterium]|nr:RNA polymerase sigma factor [Nannocystaceae bacterium]
MTLQPPDASPVAHAIAAAADDLRRLAWCLARGDGSDDLVQDTLVAALSVDPPRPERVRPWLRQVMRNELRMRVRRDRRRHARERALVLDASAPALDDVAVREELVAAMQAALAALADPYRSVLQARFLHGRAPADISREGGTPAATVRWQIHEGLRRIRTLLDERYGDRQRWCGGAIALAAAPGRSASRATGVTMTSKLFLLPWIFGGAATAGAIAIAAVHASPPTTAITTEPTPATSTLASDAVRSRAGALWHEMLASPASSVDGAALMTDPDADCDGGCTAPADDAAPAGSRASGDPIAAVFASCEHLVPDDQRDGRYEITIEILGGPDDIGNTIAGVSVTRGRKIPCVDPDADFDQVDGPDVVHFAAVAECMQHSLDGDLVDPIADGERRTFPTVLRDDALERQRAEQDDWALPPPSPEVAALDPEQAVAGLSVPSLNRAADAAPASISVIECGGYDCTFCNKARKTLAALQTEYGDAVSLHFLQLPLPM